MAQIRHFKIGGLSGRRRAISYDLSSSVNVFWGLNGTGKTSLLKILHSAMTGDASSLLRVPFMSADVAIAVRDEIVVRKIDKERSPKDIHEEELLIAAAAEETEVGVDTLLTREMQMELLRRARDLGWSRSAKDKREFKYPLSHRYLPISRVSDTRSRRVSHQAVAEMLDEATFDQLFARQIQEIWRDYYSSSLLRIRSVQERGLAEIVSIVLGQSQRHGSPDVDLDSERAYNLVRQFFQMQRLPLALKSTSSFLAKYESDPLVRRIVAEIADVQKEVDRAQEPQRRIEELVTSLFAGGKQVELGGREVEIRAGPLTIPLESLSSGEKQMLRILVECVAAGSNCIMIDEPELSMHVDWQHRLVECMRTVNPSAQIILATHSPEVMANLPDSAIFEL